MISGGIRSATHREKSHEGWYTFAIRRLICSNTPRPTDDVLEGQMERVVSNRRRWTQNLGTRTRCSHGQRSQSGADQQL
jgi:hypothetical protein